MEIYVVGGAVRDRVMGREPKDIDYVVVGSTPEEMLNLGYQQVGADFPVFLHPSSGDEYALARTERKSGKGYLGFEVNADDTVTLEDDLMRRDLTMNSMAVPLTRWEDENWQDHIIDPHKGCRDIEHKILRHTTIAFRDDPVRVLRIARFAARYDFKLAHETHHLIFDMIPELYSLQPDRVWGELSRALMEPYVWRFFETLEDCGAVRAIFPLFDLNRMIETTYMNSLIVSEELGRAVEKGLSLEQRYAIIAGDLESGQHADLKVPSSCAKMASCVKKTIQRVIDAEGLNEAALRKLVIDLKMRQQPEFASDVLFAIRTMCFADDELDEQFAAAFDLNVNLLWECNEEINKLDKAELSSNAKAAGHNIGDAIAQAELQAIRTVKGLWDAKYGH